MKMYRRTGSTRSFSLLVALLLGLSFSGVACSDDPQDPNQGEVDAGEDANGEDPDANGEDPDANGEDPDANGEDPDANGDDPDANGDDPDANGDDPDADDPDAGDPDADDPDANGEEPDGNTCEEAIDVTEGVVLIGESLEEMTDEYDPVIGTECPAIAISGADRVYVVSPEEETTYNIRLEPNDDLEAMIYVREDCDAAACTAGTRLRSNAGVLTLAFDAPGGVDSFIIVDAEFFEEGDGLYDLMVSIDED